MKTIIPIIILAVLAGCSSVRSTAKRYDTRLTTIVHNVKGAYTYNKLDVVYNPNEWMQKYAGNYIDSDYYYIDNWLRFRASPKINCTLYTRTDPYGHEQGNNQMFGRKTVSFDMNYDITSDFQIQTGVSQQNYEYDAYNPPWSAEYMRTDNEQLFTDYNKSFKRTDSETKLGFNLRKQYSNISANVYYGNRAYVYTKLDAIPDSASWDRRYEGNFIKKDYVRGEMNWRFYFSPKFRGAIEGRLTPDLFTNGNWSPYDYNKLQLTTFYKLNNNLELQVGIARHNYVYGAVNPYNLPAWSADLYDPTYSRFITNSNYERKQAVDDVWIGFELRP